MSSWLEIIIPAQNPDTKLLETGASLAAQAERGFGVVLSDNFSTSGQKVFTSFCEAMKSADIPVRRIKPPRGIGRVQHLNWVHGQAEAEWLKPLSAGGSLKPGYVAGLRWRIETKAAAQIVRCEFESSTAVPFKQENLSPAEFLNYFPAHGSWLGGLANVAYRRAAWQAAGGWPPHLPALGGLKLAATLALRHGIEMIHEPLVSPMPGHRVAGVRTNRTIETWLMLCELRNYCLSVNLPWPKSGVMRGTAGSFFGKF